MFSRRQLRHWASCMLMLWLLGIGTALANHCLAAGLADATDAQAMPPGCTGHGAGGDKANCKDYCSKVAQSVPSSKVVLDHLDAAIESHPGAALLPLVEPAAAQAWAPSASSGAPPPIVIAFLRLAR